MLELLKSFCGIDVLTFNETYIECDDEQSAVCDFPNYSFVSSPSKAGKAGVPVFLFLMILIETFESILG